MATVPQRPVPSSLKMERTTVPANGRTAFRPPVHVLVVDDHRLLRQELRNMLGFSREFTVVGEAVDGTQACELAQQLQPDVILMDIHMPKMNGIDATRWIKTRLPHIMIIGLSVNTSGAAAHDMKAAGASAYLSKEIAPEDLCQAIYSVMTK